MDHYTLYDSEKVGRLKDCLSSAVNNGNTVSTRDIEHFFDLTINSAGQLVGHLASVGVLTKQGVGKDKRYMYSVNSSNLEEQISDVRTDIVKRILAQKGIYEPTDAVCVAVKDNKMYVLQKTREMPLYSDAKQNTMTNEILVDCIEPVILENPKKAYRKIIENLGFDYSRYVGNVRLVNDIKKYAVEKGCSFEDLQKIILRSLETEQQKPYISMLLKCEFEAEATGHRFVNEGKRITGIMYQTIARNDVLVAELENTTYGSARILNVSKINSGNLTGELDTALIYPISNEDAVHLLRLAEFEKPPHQLSKPIKHINSLKYM
ncbi:MAG: hypothetical protein KAI53_01725 [Candidatus Aenigmarchaeota archaeon]|nr:hypothetical protein [Candidatus Aenigmarchaeota archaeon]